MCWLVVRVVVYFSMGYLFVFLLGFYGGFGFGVFFGGGVEFVALIFFLSFEGPFHDIGLFFILLA